MHIYIFWFQKTQSTPPKFVGHRRGNAAPRTVRSDGPQFQLRILGLLQEVLPEKCKATRIFWGISWEISCDMMGTQTFFFFFGGFLIGRDFGAGDIQAHLRSGDTQPLSLDR